MPGENPSIRRLIAAAALVAACLTAWAPALATLAERWTDPTWSHGWLVPILAVGLLVSRRRRLPEFTGTPAWSGPAVLAAALAVERLGATFFIEPLQTYSLLLAACGVCLALGGGSLLRWAAPAVGLLAFMIPLPFAIESIVSYQLQEVASALAAAMLNGLGCAATRTGTVLHVDGLRLGVAEACSGLRMLMVLAAICVLAATRSRRPGWQRGVMVGAAVPLAVLVNGLRIAATAFVYREARTPQALAACHDAAGWLMPALAVAGLWGLTRLLDIITDRRSWSEIATRSVAQRSHTERGSEGERGNEERVSGLAREQVAL